MAYASAIGEVCFPVLLVLGLGTRYAALGLMGMTAIIQLTVPDGWQNSSALGFDGAGDPDLRAGQDRARLRARARFKCRGRADRTLFLIRRKGAPPIGVFLAARGDPLTTIDFARNERPARPPERLAINQQDAPAEPKLAPDKPAEKRRDFADAWRPAGQPVYSAESGSRADAGSSASPCSRAGLKVSPSGSMTRCSLRT